MTTTQKVLATRRFTVEFTKGKNDQFIEVMNAVHLANFGQGLDSLDLGDAMGAAMKMTEEEGIWAYVSDDMEFSITAEYNDDLFIWEPPLS